MEQLILEEDEFELFKGTAKLVVGKKQLETDVHLTTKYISLVITTKAFLSTKTETEKHAVSDVKIYDDKPQIKQKKETVDIYFKDSERVLIFPTAKDATAFAGETIKFLTGKSKFVRIVEKTKEVINEVDETLNINSMGIVKTVAAVSGKKIGGIFLKNKIGSNKETLKIEGGIFKKKETKTLSLTPEEQMEAVRGLKELLDEGAITEEEFHKKKKEILGV